MVSGLVTSPWDQPWISSGDANRSLIESKFTARGAGYVVEIVLVDDGVDIVLLV